MIPVRIILALLHKFISENRMHSSRMRTARSLTASPYLVVSHACPPPGATMHAPPEQPHTPPRATPPGATTCPLPLEQPCIPRATTPPPEQSCTLPPEQPCTPPEQPRTPLWTEWQTGVKMLPCPKLRLRAVTMTHQDGDHKVRWVPNSLSLAEHLAIVHM